VLNRANHSRRGPRPATTALRGNSKNKRAADRAGVRLALKVGLPKCWTCISPSAPPVP
jgi:hypothetical protein